jgi:methylthioribose-1-phosphate isomerase
MRKVYGENRSAGVAPVKQRLKEEAQKIHAEDIAANRALGQHGARLVGSAARVMTHCNAGALATAGYGTALGVVRAMRDNGKKVEVFANETRPFFQGARLTAWELKKEKIPVTVVTDNSMGYVIQKGNVDVVIVGCDRVAANGDVANKIGTYTLAVVARRHGVPFYVAAPTSSFDLKCGSGSEIPIEERDSNEVSHLFGKALSPAGVRVLNPAFDVTPHELVSAFITEKGIITPPFKEKIRDYVHHQ